MSERSCAGPSLSSRSTPVWGQPSVKGKPVYFRDVLALRLSMDWIISQGQGLLCAALLLGFLPPLAQRLPSFTPASGCSWCISSFSPLVLLLWQKKRGRSQRILQCQGVWLLKGMHNQVFPCVTGWVEWVGAHIPSPDWGCWFYLSECFP